MNVNLLFSTWFAFTIVLLVSGAKYHHICDCGYVDVYDSIPGKFNITFICVETTCENVFLTNDRTAICKKNDYHFYKSAIGSITFEACELREMPQNIFDIYNNVQIMNISHLNIDKLPQKFFNGAKNLSKFFATNNRLVEIPSFWFHKSNKLTDVDFSFNKIKEIDDLTFFGDLNLEKVNLSHNQLTVLNRKLLEDHVHLTHLDVSSNQIAEIKSNTFQSLRNLMHLDVSSNPIKSIDNATFLTLVKLQHLNLSHMLLKVIKPGTFLHQIDLETLDLSKNHIEILDANIFSPHLDNLELFSVADNPLEILNGFTSLIFSHFFGLESAKFKCVFLKTTSIPTNWKSLDTVPRRLKCILNSNGENIEHQYLIASSEKPTTNSLTIENTTKTMSTINERDEIKTASADMPCKGFHSANSSQHLIVTTWINSICLIVGVIVLILLVMRRQWIGKTNIANVFYRRNESESSHTIESADCQTIINK